MNAESKTGYAPIHGMQLYYEIHGQGKPMVLLHGRRPSVSLRPMTFGSPVSGDRSDTGQLLRGRGRKGVRRRHFHVYGTRDAG